MTKFLKWLDIGILGELSCEHIISLIYFLNHFLGVPPVIHVYLFQHYREECVFLERILAILVEEADYGRELAAYLSARTDFIFRPHVFYDRETYCAFDADNHVDMLLCNEREAMEHGKEYRADNICVLSEFSTVNESCEYPGIFKYQSSEQIMQDIIDYYGRRKPHTAAEEAVIDGRRTVCCVCSPIGGSFCSTYALALADYFSRGGRTLFISFDPFFLIPGENKNPANKDMTDLLYYLEVKGTDPLGFIGRICRHHGNLDYLPGVSHWFDIAVTTYAQTRTLLEALCEGDTYENIVFDLGPVGSASIELLARSSRIYLTRVRGARNDAVIEEWKRQLRFAGRLELLDKVIEREVPFDEILDGDFSFDQLLKGRVGRFIEETEGRRYIR